MNGDNILAGAAAVADIRENLEEELYELSSRATSCPLKHFFQQPSLLLFLKLDFAWLYLINQIEI